MLTHYGVAYGVFEIPYVWRLHFTTRIFGYWLISHIEANIVAMLLHGDVHSSMILGTMKILCVCVPIVYSTHGC